MARLSPSTWYELRSRSMPRRKRRRKLTSYCRPVADEIQNRSTRDAPRRSRTLASGSATTRGQGRTTCTRSIGKCQGQRLWMLSTKTWQQDIELALGQSTYGNYFLPNDLSSVLTKFGTTDPESRRDREDG